MGVGATIPFEGSSLAVEIFVAREYGWGSVPSPPSSSVVFGVYSWEEGDG
jgi:hypothetical protein